MLGKFDVSGKANADANLMTLEAVATGLGISSRAGTSAMSEQNFERVEIPMSEASRSDSASTSCGEVKSRPAVSEDCRAMFSSCQHIEKGIRGFHVEQNNPVASEKFKPHPSTSERNSSRGFGQPDDAQPSVHTAEGNFYLESKTCTESKTADFVAAVAATQPSAVSEGPESVMVHRSEDPQAVLNDVSNAKERDVEESVGFELPRTQAFSVSEETAANHKADREEEESKSKVLDVVSPADKVDDVMQCARKAGEDNHPNKKQRENREPENTGEERNSETNQKAGMSGKKNESGRSPYLSTTETGKKSSAAEGKDSTGLIFESGSWICQLDPNTGIGCFFRRSQYFHFFCRMKPQIVYDAILPVTTSMTSLSMSCFQEAKFTSTRLPGRQAVKNQDS